MTIRTDPEIPPAPRVCTGVSVRATSPLLGVCGNACLLACHTHQTTKEVQTHSHLPSRTRTYAARQEDDGRERRRDAGAPLRHARSATARARCANGRPRRSDDGKTKVSRASPAYFPGSKSYFLAGVGIFPPIFPEIENDKRRLISDKFSGKIQPCQAGSRHGAVATKVLREESKQATPRGQAERPPLAPQTADADVPCAYEARGRAGSVLDASW